MKKFILILILFEVQNKSFCWGFYAHKQINYFALFLLPPEMLVLYKPYHDFLSEHAVDPDKRRYLISAEAARHYIDLDHYGKFPFDSLPRKWNDAVEKYSQDTLHAHGIVPWWIQVMLQRLTNAFKEKNRAQILKISAEIGHYIADAHVPLHTCSNYNGQFTNQHGIHGFWESRIPELLAEKEWDFFIGKAEYLSSPLLYTWQRILESSAAADTVLHVEQKLNLQFPADQKFSFEERNGKIIRQYSSRYATTYNKLLKNMIERRMRQAVYSVACFWYTAWINAGQPDLKNLSGKNFTEAEVREFEELNYHWKQGIIKDKLCE